MRYLSLVAFFYSGCLLAQSQQTSDPLANFANTLNPANSPTSGAVTSVNCNSNVPSLVDCTGGPITSSGTLSLTAPTFTAKTFWAGPTGGAAALPTARTIAAGDISGVAGTTYASTTTPLDVVNTAVETDLYAVTILGASNTTTTRYRMEIYGTHLMNDVGAPTFRISCYYGGTEVMRGTGATFTQNATIGAWRIVVDLVFLGATNSEFLSVQMQSNKQAATVGLGNPNSSSIEESGVGAATGMALDGTTDLILKVTAKWSAAGVNSSFKRIYATLVRYPI